MELAKSLLVNCFMRGSKNSCVFSLWAMTPRQNTWLSTPEISNGERVFSLPWQASRKFSKWLDGLLGTSGSLPSISLAASLGMMDRVLPWLPPLNVSVLV